MYQSFCTMYRSSHRRCSVRVDVLRNFAKFTGKHPCQGLFFNKVAGLTCCLNSTNSNFKNIISGAPQWSVLGSTFFILFINDIFYFITIASVLNFVNDNTFLAFAKLISEFIIHKYFIKRIPEQS